MSDSDIPPFIEKIARELCREQAARTYTTDTAIAEFVDSHWKSYIDDARKEFERRMP